VRDIVRAHVLGSALFIAFWVVLALAVFFVAIRGGLGAARATVQSQSYRARRAAAWLFAFIFVGFGIALPVVILVGNHDRANAQVGGYKLTAAEKRGRELFGQHCGVCHTLAAANAGGKVGPNLDVLKPSETLVLHTILYGCLQNPPPGNTAQACLGQGNMPSMILQGQQASDVAKFVAKVAGKE
jgi:mono/diheme cytochrome c family protein